MNEKYRYKTTPVATDGAIIKGEKYRFTVLTSRLLRIEYSEDGYFEDRATQMAINRQFDVPEFTTSMSNGLLTITTKYIELTYDVNKPFLPTSLQLRYIGKNSGVRAGTTSSVWSFGLDNAAVLGGTTRTLDNVNGACALESSIMSYGRVTALDDSHSLIICENGDVKPRTNKGIDQYLFCYGDHEKLFDYKACLKDFYKLSGSTPLLPRFALGNWWSRYHAYTQEEYTNLMKRFKEEDIPFSVSVIDMDWHYVDIDSKYGTGWTGYTWNEALFPDHKGFLKFLRDEGLEVSLNLHPQEGVAAHEAAYKEMAEAMGIDPASEMSVPFEIENPDFIENYFKFLHHPLEEEGVGFWWMDWQQGNTTRTEGLDPLWMLNHLHYIDNCKNNNRGLLFSRYAGPGSHRYPIGFSGDTYISWESLDFQPYFTASASNIGYGWWSHDIGGHMQGTRDEELTTRWVQLGTFSPINRLHSTSSEFLGKEPWKYNKIAELSMKKFLKLRHELIPYLYSMNYRAAEMGEPLVQPLYYDYPCSYAFDLRNEFKFGTEMIVSPITKPHDNKTTMGSVETFIPEGVWYDFFNHRRYKGGKVLTLFRDLYEMPVLVKSGGIIPMAMLKSVNDIENPEDMKIKVFAGSSNTFELYEDDGRTDSYQSGQYAITKMELDWSDKCTFTIHAPAGDTTIIPKNRNYVIELIGIEDCQDITVKENGIQKSFDSVYSKGVLTITVKNVCDTLEIKWNQAVKMNENNSEKDLLRIIEHLENFPNTTKDDIYGIIKSGKTVPEIINTLIQLHLDENILLALCEILNSDS